MKSAIKVIIKSAYKIANSNIEGFRNRLPINLNQSEPWNDVEEFRIRMSEIKQHTLVTEDRCFNIYQYAKYAGSKKGDIAEVGVYRGGTGMLLAKTCPSKTVHLFDTFSGMPQVDPVVDRVREKDFSDTSLEAVKIFLSCCDNAVLHPGLFPNSARTIPDGLFCFVHVDVDIFKSVKDCLEFFYDKMVAGGIIMFDDYGWRSCPGVKLALEEFLIEREEFPIITSQSQCMIIKSD